MQERVADKATIKAKVKRYNNIDGVWTFRLSEVEMSIGPTAAKSTTVKSDMVEVVALDSKIIAQQQQQQ